MPGDVTVPDVLKGKAATIWRAAFLSAFDGTCQGGGELGDQESCSAAVAWSAVKKQFKKDADSGKWVARSGGVRMNDNPLVPKSLSDEAGRLWLVTFTEHLDNPSDNDPLPKATAALAAWEVVHKNFDKKESGEWIARGTYVSPEKPEIKVRTLDRSSFGEGPAAVIMRGMSRESQSELIEEGLSNAPAQRPDFISSNDWVKMHPKDKTVGAIVRIYDEAESYDAAVQLQIDGGWDATPSPSRPEEMIFKKWIDNLDGMILVRAILVRSHDNLDWYIKEISRGHSSSLAVRVAPDEVRFHSALRQS